MPDITIVCKECGREHKVSEYAKIETLKCAGCKAPLALPAATVKRSGISVRGQQEKAPEKMPDAPRVVPDDVVPTSKAHDKEVVIKRPPVWQAFAVFLLVAGGLLYFLANWEQYRGYLQYYLWARNILALGAYLLVLVIAYHDEIWHGALCLIIPPYMLYYAFSRLESYALRGLFFAMILVLFAEVRYLPDYAVALEIRDRAAAVVERVDYLIKHAAD